MSTLRQLQERIADIIAENPANADKTVLVLGFRNNLDERPPELGCVDYKPDYDAFVLMQVCIA